MVIFIAYAFFLCIISYIQVHLIFEHEILKEKKTMNETLRNKDKDKEKHREKEKERGEERGIICDD
jgi:amino acid permease